MQKKILITGTSGFIGFHLAQLLLEQEHWVVGIDAMTEYYDVELKKRRLKLLQQNNNFVQKEVRVEHNESLQHEVKEFSPDIIIHLAAQAGVRYSLKNPREYIDTNIVGTFNIIELAKELGIEHLLMASTSSVYGASQESPFKESIKTDRPLTIYAATKSSNEMMAHSYSHIYKIPTTMFRFFTVYGPWGRPDMALFKFTRNILAGKAIDVYNHGNMYRDFTYVNDLVIAISKLIGIPPSNEPSSNKNSFVDDSVSPVAPFRIINIGNSKKIKLMDFIKAIENELGIEAQKNFMEMQIGDVPSTWSDCSLLKRLTGYSPNTRIEDGVSKFISWYRQYYNI